MEISAGMLSVLQHTLGLRPGQFTSSRNRFVADPGHHDLPALEELERAGLMKRAATPGFIHAEDIVFMATAEGLDYAIEHLPPPPVTPKRTRYDEFQDADCGHEFHEFLGINKPKYEFRQTRDGKWEYQMRRQNRYYEWGAHGAVSGEWKATKKAAKASYKEALAAFHQRMKGV